MSVDMTQSSSEETEVSFGKLREVVRWGNLKLAGNKQTIRSMWVESERSLREVQLFVNRDRETGELQGYFGVVQFYLTCRFQDHCFQLAYVTVVDDLRGEVERGDLSCCFSDETPRRNRFIDIGTIKEANSESEEEEDIEEEESGQFEEDWENTRPAVGQQRYGIAWKHMTLLTNLESDDD
ncbi:hypothetical protein BT69DRAFT_1291915 [Atractiella rhizophila]|nr:hypothetical protein BT69DRAFT_1291915 [Atractiella rhizophila]